jgi:hypothetical protein
MRKMFAVIHNDTGRQQRAGYEPWGTIISTHSTEEAAIRAFKKRNAHLGKQSGLVSVGTFDQIVELDDDGTVKEV